MPQKLYTRIYTAYDDYGYLQLLLYNETNGDALLFDGLNFVYTPLLTNVPSDFKQLKYPETIMINSSTIYEVEEIKQLDELTFIKFKNGDLFQLYFMMDDEKSNQRLSIFYKVEDTSTIMSSGISLYDSALKRLKNAEDCEIQIQK